MALGSESDSCLMAMGYYGCCVDTGRHLVASSRSVVDCRLVGADVERMSRPEVLNTNQADCFGATQKKIKTKTISVFYNESVFFITYQITMKEKNKLRSDLFDCQVVFYSSVN